LPQYTILCIALSVLSSLLIFVNTSSESFLTLSFHDSVGISLQALSSAFLGLSYVLQKKIVDAGYDRGLTIVFSLVLQPIVAPFFALAFGENWNVLHFTWSHLTIPLYVFQVSMMGFGTFLNSYSIDKLGPAVFGAVLPFRLPVALIAAGLVLGELFSLWTQWLGVALVFLTVAAYLINQALPPHPAFCCKLKRRKTV
jgi:drug/metabolite transporter (DMT)-like permease